VRQYQKGKTNLDFTEARYSEWQWHQLGHMQVCTLLQTDNHASTPPLSFLHAGCPSCHPTNSVKALKAKTKAQTCGFFNWSADRDRYACGSLWDNVKIWCLLLGTVQMQNINTNFFSYSTVLHPLNGLFSRTTWVSRYHLLT